MATMASKGEVNVSAAVVDRADRGVAWRSVTEVEVSRSVAEGPDVLVEVVD